jgi:hypothetical protein
MYAANIILYKKYPLDILEHLNALYTKRTACKSGKTHVIASIYSVRFGNSGLTDILPSCIKMQLAISNIMISTLGEIESLRK